LRCADALRQRGTLLKTSGGYEVLVDSITGSAVYALRRGDSQLFLLSVPEPFQAGEANIAGNDLGATATSASRFIVGHLAIRRPRGTQSSVRLS
jgi:hypothetical protein